MRFNKQFYVSSQISAHENDTILTERFKGVTIFTLNRPEKQNAFNRLMLNELAHRLHSFEADDESSVAVINGSGGNFSAGYDIEELRQNEALDKTDLCKNLIVSELLLKMSGSV